MAADTKTRMRTSRASTGCIRRRPHRSECPPLERQYSDSDSGKRVPTGRSEPVQTVGPSLRTAGRPPRRRHLRTNAFGGNVRRQRRIGHRNRRLRRLGCTRQARMSVYQRPLYSRDSMLTDTRKVSFAQFGHVALLVEKRHADFLRRTAHRRCSRRQRPDAAIRPERKYPASRA